MKIASLFNTRSYEWIPKVKLCGLKLREGRTILFQCENKKRLVVLTIKRSLSLMSCNECRFEYQFDSM